MNHLNNKRAYAYVDEFNKQKTSTPGAISRVHPKLINLKKLKDSLEIGMKSAQCNKEQVVKEWKKMHQDIEELTNTIPHFKVFIQYKSWGLPSNRLEVGWPVIECAVKD
eukprot:5188490-Ditylum_brightwellii.AAC.1